MGYFYFGLEMKGRKHSALQPR